MGEYLENYAHPRAKVCFELILRQFPQTHWKSCCVIPIRQEKQHIVDLIQCFKKSTERLLVILVVNESQPQASKDILPSELQLTFKNGIGFKYLTPQVEICLVDAFSKEFHFSSQAGVGLARKLGFDIALYLHKHRKISNPYVASLDADCLLEENYLTHLHALSTESRYSAVIADFKHIEHSQHDAESFAALQIYERHLKYIERGLEYANSPFAYTSLGSTMIIHTDAYEKVRGFPDRLAGEDFYILGKLRKLQPIWKNNNLKVYIKNRKSTRTPFGTGTAQLSIQNQATAFRTYHPDCFFYLKIFLETLEWGYPESQKLLSLLKATFSEHVSIEPHKENLLTHLGLYKHLEKISCTSKQPAYIWFDQLKTVKWLNYFKIHITPSIEIDLAEENLEKMMVEDHF